MVPSPYVGRTAISNFISHIQHFYSLVKADTTFISLYIQYICALTEWTAAATAYFDDGSWNGEEGEFRLCKEREKSGAPAWHQTGGGHMRAFLARTTAPGKLSDWGRISIWKWPRGSWDKSASISLHPHHAHSIPSLLSMLLFIPSSIHLSLYLQRLIFKLLT